MRYIQYVHARMYEEKNDSNMITSIKDSGIKCVCFECVLFLHTGTYTRDSCIYEQLYFMYCMHI